MGATDIIAGIALICAIIAIVLDFVKGGTAGSAGPAGPKGPIGVPGSIDFTNFTTGNANTLANTWVTNTSYLSTLADAVAGPLSEQIPKNTAVAQALAKDLAQTTGVSMSGGSGQKSPFSCTYSKAKSNWDCKLNGTFSIINESSNDSQPVFNLENATGDKASWSLGNTSSGGNSAQKKYGLIASGPVYAPMFQVSNPNSWNWKAYISGKQGYSETYP